MTGSASEGSPPARFCPPPSKLNPIPLLDGRGVARWYPSYRPQSRGYCVSSYAICRFLRWLIPWVRPFLADISPLPCMGGFQYCRERNRRPGCPKSRLHGCRTLSHTFRDHKAGDALRGHPWPESSADDGRDRGVISYLPSTKLIPPTHRWTTVPEALALIDVALTTSSIGARTRAWALPRSRAASPREAPVM